MVTELFRTPSGSRLYGLAHADSDFDVYIVTDSRRARGKHRTDGLDDVNTVGIARFLELASSGAHQALEAAFSPQKTFTEAGLAWAPMLAGLRVASPDAFAKFARIITAFSYGDFKRRRHAVRLSHALTDLRRYGRFNPVMMPGRIDEANRLATEHAGDELVRLLLP